IGHRITGTIPVTREGGGGSEFVVSFCFKVKEDSEKPDGPGTPGQGEKEEEDTAAQLLRGKKILLVEDNELNREIAQTVLEEAGLLIDTADDGTDAVETIQKALAGAYDLILMDIQMPVMDGYTATRTIRAMEDPAKAKIPIVAMTANAFEEDRQKALEAGMNGHVPKPIDILRLMETLKEILVGEG
ncbi:MAG: response regulator, partial [Oscillospiraceae bacterium]|nr:response regulator [Oscillospiraceae bacterium]